LDSSIVFYENLKEDVRGGATVRASAEKSFSTAYSTIVKADISSLIGAVVLYWLSVGPVRGFAFMLGAATVLDLVAAFFFLRPAVVLLSRSKQGQHPSRFGIPIDDLDAATAAATTIAGAATSDAEDAEPSTSGSTESVPTGKER
jgi:preprotein translocase subunit SecD